ncbi:hypothetical protein C9374_005390 [Naegleria lovaniensis]|uniref:tRNA-dihydrouridine(47) synthase [NAD(P)(+)] n=1 Tax=Naegleria lovaniensis TaxID=51637 RepID=A0AA88KJT4_NAELO|nr:uncharacterized protein C9374_005390 [Naegleria lovaniensis]KAG2382188.1 hypothetical protein C9374_005390 [Naegleria lovaniensis]
MLDNDQLPSSSSHTTTEVATTAASSTNDNRRKGIAPIKAEYLIVVEKHQQQLNNNPEKANTTTSEEQSLVAVTTPSSCNTDETQTVDDSEKKRKLQEETNINPNKAKKTKSFHNRTKEALKKEKKEKQPEENGEQDEGTSTAVRPKDEYNFLDHSIVKLLRKKAYNFQKADEITKHVEEFVKKEADIRSKANSEENILRQRQQQIAKQKMIERGENVEEWQEKFNILTYKETKYHPKEVKKVDFKRKTYLAPLTTVGNLPFRRICKDFGCEITIGEMALAQAILKGERGDISLLRRHESEKIFGVQLAGKDAFTMTRVAQLIDEQFPHIDFVDVNCGCPVNSLCSQGMGAGMMEKRTKLVGIVRGMKEVLSIPVSVKMRTGAKTGKNFAHKLMADLCECGVDSLTLHGRSREMRYTKEADYDYIYDCARVVNNYSQQSGRKVSIIGNGDIYSYQDWYAHVDKVDTLMIGRGALIKPWIFKEIEMQQTLDVTASERLEMLKSFVKYGLDHYGADDIGISKTRRFLLEWLSFLYRYIPVGLLERLPIKLNERPLPYVGRNELETLMASSNCKDWVKLTELAGLPKVGDDFVFIPKHKSNSYEDGDTNG